MNKISIAGLSLFFVQQLSAGPLVFAPVRVDNSDDSQSVAVDPSTGKYYQRPGHGVTPQEVLEYADFAAFEAGLPSRSVTMEGGFYGTYFVANNGSLYARTEFQPDQSGSDSSRFNLATGAKDFTVSFPGLLTLNGDGTFDWGGLTSVNFYNDPSGLYFLGKSDAGQTWNLSKVDANLNILETKTFESPTLGFATMVNGKLFTGEHYDGAGFDHVFDYSAGTYTDVDFDFEAGATHYFTDVVYDPAIDTMYLHNWDDRTFYKVGDVARTLGAPRQNVPEGGSGIAFFGLAMGGLLITSRSLRSAKS